MGLVFARGYWELLVVSEVGCGRFHGVWRRVIGQVETSRCEWVLFHQWGVNGTRVALRGLKANQDKSFALVDSH